MTEFDDESGGERRSEGDRRVYPRFRIERTLRALANEDFRIGRLEDVSAGGAVVHLDEVLEEGTEVTLDIEDLGSFTGHVSGPSRDGMVPIKFDNDQEAEDRLIAEIMKIQNDIVFDDE